MSLTDGRGFMSAAALKTDAAEREGEDGILTISKNTEYSI
jgi:hypothetical protein